MIFNFNECDCTPLVIDNEFEIIDEELLAEYVGRIILGHFVHVKRIIQALASDPPEASDDSLDSAILALKRESLSDKDIEKRDGWIFQIISWLALLSENKGKKFYSQQPHDAPAQHGLDGLAVILNDELKIESIIISEDKCTENHRVVIPKQVWPEFEEFEQGLHTNKLVSRISAMLEHLDSGSILQANQNTIYLKGLWQYRVGINRTNTYDTNKKRRKLFKGYDECVTGEEPHRRFAVTIHKEDIRGWMEQFSKKVIRYLESQKIVHV